jgi:N-formylglutamate deformylase
LYRPGLEPDAAERERRVATYWRPYHDALAAELARLRERHGHVVLFDAHSIRSELPWLFEGMLPHLNLGTVDGSSCAPDLRDDLMRTLGRHEDRWSWVADERFKGGHITRAYGRPREGVHAVQMEMCWRTYMDEDPPAWNDARADAVSPLLHDLVHTLLRWRPA